MASNSSYEAAAAEIAELFGDYLDGDATRPAFALSVRPLDPEARNAIEKSLESFGYAAGSCTYATLLPADPEAEGGDISLDPQALFTLVEALDPLMVIVADAESTAMLAKAYRTELPASDASSARLFGRPAATFDDLATLLQTAPGKQAAWRPLKSLNQ